MKALGLTCGIGSMLIGARSAEFKVIGNVEWRLYYHTGTFEKNFGDAFMVKDIRDADIPRNIEAVFSHTECGNFSNLRTNVCKYDDPGDIPKWIEMIKTVKPQFFVADNLPRSLIAVPMERYLEAFPEYDLFPEWVSNYHYGNTQKNRRRFFLIGARKEQKFVFAPGEFIHGKTLQDVIGDLPVDRDIFEINHVHRRFDQIMPQGWAAHQLRIQREGNKITFGEFAEYIRDHPPYRLFQYYNKHGELKDRPGYFKIGLDHHSPVMTGGGSALDNHYRSDTLLPLTTRERARIQGCPDDFLFYPMDHASDPRTDSAVYKQVGKFMPVEFCTFVAEQIMAHLRQKPFVSASRKRMEKPSPFVDEAKMAVCRVQGTDQERCRACWIQECSMSLHAVRSYLRSMETVVSAPASTPLRARSTIRRRRIKSYGGIEKTPIKIEVFTNVKKGG